MKTKIGKNGSGSHNGHNHRSNGANHRPGVNEVIVGSLEFTVIADRGKHGVQIEVTGFGGTPFPKAVKNTWLVDAVIDGSNLEPYKENRGVSFKPGNVELWLEQGEKYVALVRFNPESSDFKILGGVKAADYEDARKAFVK